MNHFNSKEYTYCDIEVYMLGRLIGGLRGIEYKTKKNKESLYGSGRKARSIQHGKREYEGTITVTQSELIALDRAALEAGFEDCLDLDFDIIVTYLSPNGIVTVDKIIQASITESGRSMKEGDMLMEVSLPFICLDITKNVA